MEQYDVLRSVEDLCAHAGQGSGDGQPLVAPIVASTTFCRNEIGSPAEHAYSRVSNPTVSALETVMGKLEQAPPAVCFASGLAAETALFFTLLRSGDHVVCSRAVYGGTTRLLQQVFSSLGVDATIVDTTQATEVAGALQQNTRLVFVETPANPTLDLTDIAEVASTAHQAGAMLAVDNTFMTAVLQQPLPLGADISVYSTTKFIDGHSVALGGAVVSRDSEFLERLRFTRKSTGGIQSAFNAWLTLQGLKTLPLRIRRQSQTAACLAPWLDQQPFVSHTYYPSLSGSSNRVLANRQHLGYHGAVVSFELEKNIADLAAVLRRLRLCRLVEHVGSVETLLTHPASMTHADVPKEQRERVGISDGLLRLSVGLEDAHSIMADITQAIAGAGDEHTKKARENETCPPIAS